MVYGSYLRPILNMRPKFRYRIWAAPPRFPADLYLVDWLDHFGIEVDFLTDHDLQAEGAALLEPYAVVVSSSHHEYWSGPMLDALETYLGGGGRFMYVGGNSLFGVASFDPDPAKPHKVEVRRWGAPWPFEVAAGRAASTRRPASRAERGGTAVGRRTGSSAIGTSAAGFDRGGPVRRMPDSHDPRVGFIFEGIGDDELIGDQPNLQIRWGAAGYEIDRFDHELGTPASALLLASSVGFSDLYRPMVDEVLWFIQGRDGKRAGRPAGRGRAAPLRPLGHGLSRVSERRRGLLGRARSPGAAASPTTATTTRSLGSPGTSCAGSRTDHGASRRAIRLSDSGGLSGSARGGGPLSEDERPRRASHRPQCSRDEERLVPVFQQARVAVELVHELGSRAGQETRHGRQATTHNDPLWRQRVDQRADARSEIERDERDCGGQIGVDECLRSPTKARLDGGAARHPLEAVPVERTNAGE